MPSTRNLPDTLTRVPSALVQMWKARCEPEEEVPGSAAAAAAAVAPALKQTSPVLPLSTIADSQKQDATIAEVIDCVISGKDVALPEFQKVRNQLVVSDGMLMRSVRLPTMEIKVVPAIPASLTEQLVEKAHSQSGHSSWQTTWKMLRESCYWPYMAEACQEYVAACQACAIANPQCGEAAQPGRPSVPSGPWSTVYIDTLELGGCTGGGQYHCVLVCTDAFTKWVEVVPLRHHNARSVAAAFLSVCTRWGPPDVIRCDNGKEFVNAIMSALFDYFGTTARHGAVRPPQSQGAVERFNQTLLTLIRKTLDLEGDWRTALDLMLYKYRSRPHGATGISPAEAMTGWRPKGLLVEWPAEELLESAWVDQLRAQTARIWDFLEGQLSEADFVESETSCPYSEGAAVLLRKSGRRQKRQSLYEAGWLVHRVVSPSTVQVVSLSGAKKIVNIDLLKRDPCPAPEESSMAEVVPKSTKPEDNNDDAVPVVLMAGLYEDEDVAPIGGGRQLRDRSHIQAPARYRCS